MAIIPLLMALAVAQDGAKAQDGLTPTDVLPMGRFTAGARLMTELGQGTLEAAAGTIDEDAELRSFLLRLEAAVGLGGGFEIEGSILYAFTTELEIDAGGFEVHDESQGFGDLTLGANFSILQDSPDGPQLIVGGFIVLPTGDDDRGELEVISGGTTIQPGEEGGIGSGAFQFGFQAGISKRFSQVEPYFLFRYLFGGDADDGDIETELADVGTVLLGMEIHAGDQVTIDLRAVLEFRTDEVEETSATSAESTEEAHGRYGLEGRLYASLGPSVAIVVGIGFRTIEDHAISEESDFNLNDVFVFGAELGLQIVFGK